MASVDFGYSRTHSYNYYSDYLCGGHKLHVMRSCVQHKALLFFRLTGGHVGKTNSGLVAPLWISSFMIEND